MKTKEQLVAELSNDLESLRRNWRMGHDDPKNLEAWLIDKLADVYGQLVEVGEHLQDHILATCSKRPKKSVELNRDGSFPVPKVGKAKIKAD